MQFTLQTLLLAFVVIWAALAAFGPCGIAAAAVLLAAAAGVRSADSQARMKGRAFTVLLCVLVCFGLICMLPGVRTTREAARWATCRYNLRRVALALQQYHEAYGSFPPAYVSDAKGKPMHSWRALILPFLEDEKASTLYRFDEPWDGPNNSKLTMQVPEVYRCPSDWPAYPPGNTSYVAVVDPEAAWPGMQPRRLEELPDDGRNTILVVEAANSGINWLEPRDSTVQQACASIVAPAGQDRPSGHPLHACYLLYPERRVNVLFADGRCAHVTDEVAPEVLQGMLRTDNAEPIERSAYVDPWERLNWTHTVGLIVLVLSYAVLLLRPLGLPQK